VEAAPRLDEQRDLTLLAAANHAAWRMQRCDGALGEIVYEMVTQPRQIAQAVHVLLRR
jgi:hypothetical protein